DTAFYKKINLASRFGDDTVRYAKWAEKGIEKFPDNVALLQDAGRAFAMSGNADGAVDVTRRLLAIDPSDYEPLRVTAATLAQAGQPDKILEFVPAVASSGDEDLQNTFGGLLVNAASNARTASDTAAQVKFAKAALEVGTTNPQLTSFAGFFVGEPLYPKITGQAESIRQSKSCPAVQEYAQMVKEAAPAFKLATSSTNAQIAQFASQLVPFLERELVATEQMLAAVCR